MSQPTNASQHQPDMSARTRSPENLDDMLDRLRELAIDLHEQVESLAKENPANRTESLTLREKVHRYELELIHEALRRTKGNQRKAAKLLGIKPSTLNSKLKSQSKNDS